MKDEEKTKEQLVNESVELRQRAGQATLERRVWLPVAGMFVLLCIFVWLDEIVDFPRLLLGAPPTPTNWQEALLETALVVAIGFFAVSNSIHAIKHKRAEEALGETSDYLGKLLDYANAPIIVWGTEFKVVRFNRAFERLTGYTADQVIGQELHMLFPDATRDESLNKIERTSNGEYWESVEIPILRQDGDIRLVLWNSANIHTEDDTTILATIAQGTDITERVWAEDALRESEERLQTILNSVQAGIVIIDAETHVIADANPVAVEIIGVPKEQIVGHVCHKFICPAEEGKCPITDLGQTVDRSEHVLLKASGESIPILKTVTPVILSGHRYLIDSFLDITERKREEREIEERRSYLESVLACAPDAIVTLDGQRNILEWNLGAERLFGYTLQEVVGCNLDDLITGSDANAFEEATGLTWRVLAGKSVPATEVVRYRKDGSPVDVIASGSPILIGDEVTGVVAVYTDITERKRMEEQLRQQERLAAVGQLAGGIAHDFNNFLTTVILYAQIPLRKHDLPPRVVRNLEAILGESRKAAELVQQILDFSRRAMIEVQPLDLKSFTKEVIAVLRRTIPESVHLTLEVEPGEYVVKADPIRIQQVLMNLATNGRDAMPEGGELRFGLSRVEVGPGEEPPDFGELGRAVAEMAPGEWVCLAVSDTGTGMTEEVRAHLFEPFFTTKEPGKGTGLGLAQVYGIVRQHEGYIGVETETGKGTTFHIYFPASGAAEEVAEEEVSATPRGQGETILLVEDSEQLLEVGRTILESLGYRALTAADGREALEVYEAEGGACPERGRRIDLVIADLVMPKMGGQELMQELRKGTPDLKGLAITGYAVQEDAQALKEAGFLDLVRKPFDLETLAEVVRHALDVD